MAQRLPIRGAISGTADCESSTPSIGTTFWKNFIVSQGDSYFRTVARPQIYGLSARGQTAHRSQSGVYWSLRVHCRNRLHAASFTLFARSCFHAKLQMVFPRPPDSEEPMNQIVYIVGFVVIVLIILGFFGLR
jgi:hypothetical protein